MTLFNEMHPKARVGAVNAFRIWRVGQSVNWDCSFAEIAEELGLTCSAVSAICNRRGWKASGARRSQDERIAVDSVMKRRTTQGLI